MDRSVRWNGWALRSPAHLVLARNRNPLGENVIAGYASVKQRRLGQQIGMRLTRLWGLWRRTPASLVGGSVAVGIEGELPAKTPEGTPDSFAMAFETSLASLPCCNLPCCESNLHPGKSIPDLQKPVIPYMSVYLLLPLALSEDSRTFASPHSSLSICRRESFGVSTETISERRAISEEPGISIIHFVQRQDVRHSGLDAKMQKRRSLESFGTVSCNQYLHNVCG
ncbi:hypothetical protein M3J09_013603 [Ascochyta lentis]